MGTSLFINEQRAAAYGLDPTTFGGWSVVSNRVVGLHLGVKGAVTPRLAYRLLATYVQHYGNYYNDALFTPTKRQTWFSS